MVTLDEIHKKVIENARKISASNTLFPTFGDLHYDGTPCILIEREQFTYTAKERNNVVMNKQTNDIDELLFWVFEDITFFMASDYELNHRINNLDSRRLLHTHQLELLGNINIDWARRRAIQIEEVLKNSPYRDK